VWCGAHDPANKDTNYIYLKHHLSENILPHLLILPFILRFFFSGDALGSPGEGFLYMLLALTEGVLCGTWGDFAGAVCLPHFFFSQDRPLIFAGASTQY
jgi:hypothetical protein